MGHREDLLEGAKRCLLEKGFVRTTARDIVKESGTNLASIGYHYGSKDKLLAEAYVSLVEGLSDDFSPAMGTAGETGPGSLDRFQEVWSNIIATMRQPGSLWRLSVEIVAMGDQLPTVRDHLAQAQREAGRGIIPLFLGGKEEDVSEDDVDSVGQFYNTLMTGLICQYVFDPTTAPTGEQLTEGLRRVIGAATCRVLEPRPLQRHVQQQAVLAVVQVQAGQLLHPGQAVVQRLAVDAQLRRRAARLARAVEVDLGGAGQFVVGGGEQGAYGGVLGRVRGQRGQEAVRADRAPTRRPGRGAVPPGPRGPPPRPPARRRPEPARPGARGADAGRDRDPRVSFSSRAAAVSAGAGTSVARSRISSARLWAAAPHGTVHTAVACGTVRADGASSGSADGQGATHTTACGPSPRGPRAVRSAATAMSRCQPRSAVSTVRNSRVRSAPACASSASSAPIRAATSMAAVSCSADGPGSSSSSQT